MMERDKLRRIIERAIEEWSGFHSETKCGQIKGEGAENYATRTQLAGAIATGLIRAGKRQAKKAQASG